MVCPITFPRSSGVLLHPTCLPSRFGAGDLGPEAYRFIDFLHDSGQKLWQVLPLGPTGYGDSPYQTLSAFAGHTLLISLEELMKRGYLSRADLKHSPEFPGTHTSFAQAIQFKQPLLRKAAQNFRRFSSTVEQEDFRNFRERNASWLDSNSRFLALKAANQGRVWTHWTRPADPEEIESQAYWQFEFFRQWEALKLYCHQRGIRIMGDIPIYVSHDSADVWSHPELFDLDAHGNPAKVAGVPPDYFSATGQLWGNPLYRWEVLERSGYAWWIERLRFTLSVVDIVRLDHFRGFEAYWEVPAKQETAINGRWVKGPGAKLFEAARNVLGELPIVAENLGVITPEVEAIRNKFGFPGMSVLQFAFGSDEQAASFRPHNYPRNLVAYTGTHDNNTTLGWWNSSGNSDSTRSPDDIQRERKFTAEYLGMMDGEIHWAFIRAVLGSVADTAVIPLQDVLGLGSEARMNLPGTSGGNWHWRYRREMLTSEIASRLRRLTSMFDR